MNPLKGFMLYFSFLGIAGVFALVVGVVSPALVSAESDMAVWLGIFLLALIPVFLVCSIYQFIKGCCPKKKVTNKGEKKDA